MTLVSIANELRKAQAGGYALPCFDIFDILAGEGLYAALEEKRAPAIVAVYCEALDRPYSSGLVAGLRALAQEAKAPVSVMLDHGTSLEQCLQAIRVGCSDVMYDGSRLPLPENIASTRAIVRAAHAEGAGVEAELGHVGSGSDYAAYGGRGQGFTDPAEAERFVAETGVDFLAVAIGTAHGVYRSEPRLDLELLAELRRRLSVPLVLHGGTGLAEAQFRATIAGGIAKINISTDLSLTAGRYMIAAANADKASYFTIGEAVRRALRERCGYYLDLFGATGQAG